MLLDDRRMKVREIAETIGISKERVGYILREEMDMKKLVVQFICVNVIYNTFKQHFFSLLLTQLTLVTFNWWAR